MDVYNKIDNFKPQDLLSSDEIYYYSQIWKELKEMQTENKDLIENVLESIDEQENLQNLLKSKKVSSILDMILPHGAPSSYMNIIKVLESDLRVYIVDCYASHVLERVLKCCLRQLQESGEHHKNGDLTQDLKDCMESFLIKTCKFVFNNMLDFITEDYASHVLRTVLEVISGIEVHRQLKSKINVNSSSWQGQLVVPKDLSNHLPAYIDRLSNLPNYSDVYRNDCGSGVLQCVLAILHSLPDNKKLLKNLINSLIKGFSQFSNEGEISQIFTITPCCKLLEAILLDATNSQLKYIYDNFYKDKLHLLCVHDTGNFAIQRLCDSCKESEMFSEIYSILSSSITACLENGYTGILLSLVKACKRLELYESRIIHCLMALFQCSEPISRHDSFAMLLMKFAKFEDLDHNDYAFQLHGVVILQEMLHFKKSKKIVHSYLNMTKIEHLKCACDSKASHVINAFMNSESIKHKHKKQLLNVFQGLEVDLACSKSGSRSLEVLWEFADLEEKAEIGKRLMKAEKKLKENFFGKFIFQKFQLFQFKNKSAWEASIKEVNNKRKIKEEILEEFKVNSKKKIKL